MKQPSPIKATFSSTQLLSLQPRCHARTRARRDAVHRHSPGLRVVVQGAAARARSRRVLLQGRQAPSRAAHAEADPHHPQGAGRPARHPRDDDAAGVPVVPRAPRAASGFQSNQFRQIEFVLGAKNESAISRAFPRASRAARRSSGDTSEPTMWDAFFTILRAKDIRCRRHI